MGQAWLNDLAGTLFEKADVDDINPKNVIDRFAQLKLRQ